MKSKKYVFLSPFQISSRDTGKFKTLLQSFMPRSLLNPELPGNRKLFGGLGKTFDYINSLVEQLRNESRVLTAQDTIPTREQELGIVPNSSLSLDVRRSGIIARTRDSGPITIDGLANSLQAYGIVVEIHNDFANSIMRIKIVNVTGIPAGLPQAQDFIREVVRAHVEVIFEFRFLMISEVEALTISQLDNTPLDKIAWG